MLHTLAKIWQCEQVQKLSRKTGAVQVPKQTGSGGKVRLLGISKRGDTYLRTLFIHGARAAALLTKEPGPWITELKKRRPTGVAIVAMANKLARTVWAIAVHDRNYDKNHVSIRPY